MPRFLSDEWIEDLDALAAASSALEGIVPDAEEGALVIQHVVTDVPPGEDIAYHVVLGGGPARVRPGPAESATATFTQSYATARQIATGAASAQAAFMAGELRLGGRVDLLLTHHTALVAVDDVFAAVRERTEW